MKKIFFALVLFVISSLSGFTYTEPDLLDLEPDLSYIKTVADAENCFIQCKRDLNKGGQETFNIIYGGKRTGVSL